MYEPLAIDSAELTADFTKSAYLTNKDFLVAKKDFQKARSKTARKAFLNYCLAIINQKNSGALTIREAAYIIGNCQNASIEDDAMVQDVIKEASNLQRHPSNYKASHTKGWDNLVKKISTLRRKIR